MRENPSFLREKFSVFSQLVFGLRRRFGELNVNSIDVRISQQFFVGTISLLYA